MSGHTKGREAVGASGGSVTRIAWCNSPLGSALIAEAFNVADETGRTPAQLAAERAELVGMCEAVRPLLVLLAAKMNSPKEVVNTIGAIDAILAKVKGPVQS